MTPHLTLYPWGAAIDWQVVLFHLPLATDLFCIRHPGATILLSPQGKRLLPLSLLRSPVGPPAVDPMACYPGQGAQWGQEGPALSLRDR